MVGILDIYRRNERIFHERHPLSIRHFRLCSSWHPCLPYWIYYRPTQDAHAKATDTWVGNSVNNGNIRKKEKNCGCCADRVRELRIKLQKAREAREALSFLKTHGATKTLEKAYYISTIGWQSLAVRLYFLGHLGDIFVPIHPANGDDLAPVKVWEIRYPPDIETDDTYLATELERRDGD